MKKTTLLLLACLLFVSVKMNAESTLPITGSFTSGSMPTDWTYITNNPTYPTPSFYTNNPIGLKVNFENMGVLSPVFTAVGAVKVTLTVGALNQNTKTGSNTKYFTVTAFNAAGDSIGVGYLTSVIVGDNTVEITATDIAKIRVIMTGYPNDGTKYCNVNLASVTVAEKTTGFNEVNQNSLEIYPVGGELNIKNVNDGSKVEIYSTIGSRVITSVLENGKVNISNLSKGIYIVRVGKNTQKFTL